MGTAADMTAPTVYLEYSISIENLSRIQEGLNTGKQEMMIRRVELPSGIQKLPPRPCKPSRMQEVLNEHEVAS